MGRSNTATAVEDIRRNSRRKFSTEEQIRLVLEGLRGESWIAALCRREGINPNLYYRWSKDFLAAGKQRLSGDGIGKLTDVIGYSGHEYLQAPAFSARHHQLRGLVVSSIQPEP